jgi:hypothetical protein
MALNRYRIVEDKYHAPTVFQFLKKSWLLHDSSQQLTTQVNWILSRPLDILQLKAIQAIQSFYKRKATLYVENNSSIKINKIQEIIGE